MVETLLTDEEYQSILDYKPVAKDFFYVLSIESGRAEDDYLMFTTESREGVALCNNIAYASKVTANTTLSEAIRTDLNNDFNYTGNFSIEAIKPYDETTNRKGESLTRLLVYIVVDGRFATEGLDTLGMNPHWHNGLEH